MPPAALALACPSEFPVLAGAVAVAVAFSSAGWAMDACADCVLPAESVTVTVYSPAERPPGEEPFRPAWPHWYWKGPLPPVGCTSIAPDLPP